MLASDVSLEKGWQHMQQGLQKLFVLNPRAQRFPIQVPLEYRMDGETAWSKGATINISRSGVLFYSPRILQPDAMIEMRIVLPPLSTIVCSGSIVRAESTAFPRAGSLIVASIANYHMTRPKAATSYTN